MPELPDVEKWRRYLDATSLHHRVAEVDLRGAGTLDAATRRRLLARLPKASFDRTMRHGDYLFVKLREEADWLMLHLGMTGRLACLKGEESPPEHTRFLVRFADGRRLACSSERHLGRIGLVESPAAFIRESGLGPDAFLPGLSLAEFRHGLARRRGSVKSAVMDQRFIAGIGNRYSDEILFQARIHPRTGARKLRKHQTAALYATIARVLHIAIGRGADPARLPASWLLPHRKAGGACPRCATPLGWLVTSGRKAFFCPCCQPEQG